MNAERPFREDDVDGMRMARRHLAQTKGVGEAMMEDEGVSILGIMIES